MPPMSSRKESPSARPAKAPRWVSPWSFDDEWEDEQRKHLASGPQPPKREAKKTVPETSAPPPPAVAAMPVSAPAIVSRVEENFTPGSVDWVEIKEEPLPPAVEKASTKTDSFPSFRPPPIGDSQRSDDHFTTVQTETKAAPSSQNQRTRQAALPEPTDPPTQTPPKRPGPVPNSARVQAESSFSWGTLFMTSLGLAGAVMLGWIYFTDIAPPLDEDLMVQEPVDLAPKIVGPERLGTFLQAVIAIPDLRVALLPAWKWERQTLESYVRGNGAALDGLRDLLGDFDWHPRHAAWHAEDLGEHVSWPHVRILLQARVAYLLSSGNEESALLAAIDIGRLSRRLHELWAWPSYMQRAQEMHMACVQMTAQVLKQTRLGSSELKLAQDEFLRCAPLDAHLQRALGAFYLHEKKLMFGEKSGAPLDTMPGGVLRERPGRLFFKKHETLGLFANSIRVLRDQVAITPGAGAVASAIGRRVPTLSHFQPNGEGERYFNSRIEPCLPLPERHHLAKARHDLVLCLFAIRRYVADHQKLPSGLSDLRPQYLQDVLIDPFSGEPLHYDPLKGVLFSVGANFRSEDGSITEPPLADADEPTLEIGISVAAAVGTSK